jgi:hypothetical protein
MGRFNRHGHSRGGSHVAVLVLVLLQLLWPFDLSAAPTVNLQAQVFLASNPPSVAPDPRQGVAPDPRQGVAPDPRLASLIAELRNTLRYSTFQLLSSPSGRTGLGQVWRAELPPGGRTLELTLLAIEQGTIQLQARIVQANETLVNTTLRLQSGGPPVVIGGPAYQNGVLVIVIYASAP